MIRDETDITGFILFPSSVWILMHNATNEYDSERISLKRFLLSPHCSILFYMKAYP